MVRGLLGSHALPCLKTYLEREASEAMHVWPSGTTYICVSVAAQAFQPSNLTRSFVGLPTKFATNFFKATFFRKTLLVLFPLSNGRDRLP